MKLILFISFLNVVTSQLPANYFNVNDDVFKVYVRVPASGVSCDTVCGNVGATCDPITTNTINTDAKMLALGNSVEGLTNVCDGTTGATTNVDLVPFTPYVSDVEGSIACIFTTAATYTFNCVDSAPAFRQRFCPCLFPPPPASPPPPPPSPPSPPPPPPDPPPLTPPSPEEIELPPGDVVAVAVPVIAGAVVTAVVGTVAVTAGGATASSVAIVEVAEAAEILEGANLISSNNPNNPSDNNICQKLFKKLFNKLFEKGSATANRRFEENNLMPI